MAASLSIGQGIDQVLLLFLAAASSFASAQFLVLAAAPVVTQIKLSAAFLTELAYKRVLLALDFDDALLCIKQLLLRLPELFFKPADLPLLCGWELVERILLSRGLQKLGMILLRLSSDLHP